MNLSSLVKSWWWLPALLLGGWLWMHQHDAAVRASALAQERWAQLQVEIAEGAKRDTAMQALDSAVRGQRQAIEAANARTQTQLAQVRVTTAATVTALRASLDTAQQQALDSVVAGFTQQLALKDQQMAGLAEIIAKQDTVLAAKDSVLASFRRINADVALQLGKLTAAQRPSTLDKLSRFAVLGLVTVAAVK